MPSRTTLCLIETLSDVRARGADRALVDAAEADIEIFKLGRPVRREGVLDAEPDDPADLGFAAVGERRIGGGGLDMPVGDARGEIGQPAVERVAPARPRTVPSQLFFASQKKAPQACRRWRCSSRDRLRRPSHPAALKFVARRAADQRAARPDLHVAGIGEVGRVEARAAVDARVKAGPVVDERQRPRRLGRSGAGCRRPAPARRSEAKTIEAPSASRPTLLVA